MSVPSTQWKYLPPTAALCALQPFRDIIESDASITVTEADFTPHMQNLADILAAAKGELKKRLVKRTVSGYRLISKYAGVYAPLGVDLGHLKPLQLFGLASTVFTCGDCSKGLFGWDDITSHFCTSGNFDRLHLYDYPHEFEFSEPKSQAAQRVIREAGLDPSTATVADMDKKNFRFCCTTCDNYNIADQPSYIRLPPTQKEIAYTWRGLVSALLVLSHCQHGISNDSFSPRLIISHHVTIHATS